MQKIITTIVCLLSLAVAVPAVMLQQGTQEIQAEGKFDVDDAGGSSLGLKLGWGYFFNDYVEAGVRGGLALSDRADSYRLGGFGEYHFELNDALVPYLGAGLALTTTDIKRGKNQTALILNGTAGLKIFLVENVALGAQAVVEIASENIYPADDNFHNLDFYFEFGLRFFY